MAVATVLFAMQAYLKKQPPRESNPSVDIPNVHSLAAKFRRGVDGRVFPEPPGTAICICSSSWLVSPWEPNNHAAAVCCRKKPRAEQPLLKAAPAGAKVTTDKNEKHGMIVRG